MDLDVFKISGVDKCWCGGFNIMGLFNFVSVWIYGWDLIYKIDCVFFSDYVLMIWGGSEMLKLFFEGKIEWNVLIVNVYSFQILQVDYISM